MQFPSQFPLLSSSRLLLDSFSQDDLPAVFNMRSDKEVMQMIYRPLAKTMADAEALLERFRKGFENKELLNWALREKGNPKVIGIVGFFKIEADNNRAEVGYMLDKPFWGKGFAYESLLPILDFGFRQMGLHSITATVDPRNAASINVLEKAGFQREGAFKDCIFFEGEYKSLLQYTKFAD